MLPLAITACAIFAAGALLLARAIQCAPVMREGPNGLIPDIARHDHAPCGEPLRDRGGPDEIAKHGA